jgi:hypothetical protein
MVVLGDSPHLNERRMFSAVPLYLQDMLFHVSEDGYTDHPDNYDVLINESLRVRGVVFASLNYDTPVRRPIHPLRPGLTRAADDHGRRPDCHPRPHQPHQSTPLTPTQRGTTMQIHRALPDRCLRQPRP